MNPEKNIPKKISDAGARRETIGANLLGEYRQDLATFYEVFSVFGVHAPDVGIDVLSKVSRNQELSSLRNYDFRILGAGGVAVREAIRRIQYSSDILPASTYDDQLQVSETVQGWAFEDVITIPRRIHTPVKTSRLILAVDGRNWLGGMLKRETEYPTFGVEGQGDYLESQVNNWDELDNSNRKIALANIRTVISHMSEQV